MKHLPFPVSITSIGTSSEGYPYWEVGFQNFIPTYRFIVYKVINPQGEPGRSYGSSRDLEEALKFLRRKLRLGCQAPLYLWVDVNGSVPDRWRGHASIEDAVMSYCLENPSLRSRL